MTHDDRTISLTDLEASVESVDARLLACGGTHVRFWGIDDRDFDASLVARMSLDEAGGLVGVARRCADNGEEGDILDFYGTHVARVFCDGSLAWSVAGEA